MKKLLIAAIFAASAYGVLFFTACESKEEKFMKKVLECYRNEKSCDDADMIPIIKCVSRNSEKKSCDIIDNRCRKDKDVKFCKKVGEFLINNGNSLKEISKIEELRNEAKQLQEKAKFSKWLGIKYLQGACKFGDKHSCELSKKYD